ncbi:MAG: A/G-specific adenine glycosylase [Myxococcales bacterium]|nr:A/G-specific adenine glycosylase [Myxococcales bacterium]
MTKSARDLDHKRLAAQLAPALSRWFTRHQRDLAWRRTRDPYAIWVSEIMLQQTRVATVNDYYPRFMSRFPTVAALADADEDAVLQAWSGLGYYRRARLLHRGARYVLGECDGELPTTAEALRKIPGVGRYTAGAIASIAHDRPEPLVDGNVARVLSRILALEEPSEQGADAKVHWELARAILEQGSPRVLAQALMELGALVCTPQSPSCPQCPARERCQAQARGLTDVIPAPRKKVAQPVDVLWAVAVYAGDRLLLTRRPSEGLLAGMWCLPLVPRGEGRALTARAAAAALGFPVRAPAAVPGEVKHVFTHRVWKIRTRSFVAAKPAALLDEHAWVADGERPPGGLPKVTQKLLASLADARAP